MKLAKTDKNWMKSAFHRCVTPSLKEKLPNLNQVQIHLDPVNPAVISSKILIDIFI